MRSSTKGSCSLADRSALPFRDCAAGRSARTSDEGYGVVRAMDPKTGEKKWEFKMNDMTMSGILTTASDLVVHGRARWVVPGAGCAHGEVVVESRDRRGDCDGSDDL